MMRLKIPVVMMMNDGDDSVCFRIWGCRKQLCWDLCTVHKDFLMHHNRSLIFVWYYILGLNMFLVPIKLRPSKFNPYLILIAFLIPTIKILLIILVPAKINFV